MVHLKFEKTVEIEPVRSAISSKGYGDSEIKHFGADDEISIRSGSEKAVDELSTTFEKILDDAFPDNPFVVFFMGYNFNKENTEINPVIQEIERIFLKVYEIYSKTAQLPILHKQNRIGQLLFNVLNEINNNKLYKKELINIYQEFVKENKKETLAQVFTDVRYNKSDNVLFSKSLLEILRNQDFMNHP